MAEPALTRADVLDICQLLLRRGGLSAEQLARHMAQPGEPTSPAPVQAAEPSAAAAGHLTPRQIEALALADNPEGTNVAGLREAMGLKMQTAFGYLDTLHKGGHVTRVRLQGMRAAQFFKQAAHAQAWEAARMNVTRPGNTRPHLVDVGERIKSTARQPSKRPPVIKVDKGQGGSLRRDGVIVPEHVKIERHPAPVDTRYSVAPGAVLTGGFSTTAPGTLELTGARDQWPGARHPVARPVERRVRPHLAGAKKDGQHDQDSPHTNADRANRSVRACRASDRAAG